MLAKVTMNTVIRVRDTSQQLHAVQYIEIQV